ncbi:mitotic deacetylase-associated SANT domain protein isoform X3 [Electrophorus electricus]|uniref:mitotic deacetylase-associated SANT domain protein isoform X3 n=1 Tax=Electrophorus electricus TaxID=8005 RepID=UPI0015CF84CB|nr:mitotic deacetylase-associated SANT domain protein isoform X3 [Electrophorus electricus]
MKAMSLPPQQKPNAKRTGKRITFFNDQGSAMKEVSQHTEGPYYGMGAPPLEQGRTEPGAVESSSAEEPHVYLNSVIFSPEKGEQNRSHYQQTMPMKWPHMEQPQQRTATWSQSAPLTSWSQSFTPYLGAQVNFPKQLPEGMLMPQVQLQPSSVRVGEKQQQAPNAAGEAFREPAKSNRSLDWGEQQQGFQQPHKPGLLNPQQHVTSTAGNTSVLQPFQLAFGQPKQNLTAGFQVFQGNRTLPNLNYSAQANTQHQIQQMQRLMFQKQQQQHMQQQSLPHQPQPLQQQAHHLGQLQPPSQQMQQPQVQQQVQQQQQAQQASSQKRKNEQLQKLQQNQQGAERYSGSQQPRVPEQPNLQVIGQSQDTPEPPPAQAQDLAPQHTTAVPQPSAETQQPGPRRSRRLSKEGGGPPSENPFIVAADHLVQDSHNGAPDAGEPAAKQDIRAAPTGVIQSTRRKRRVSQEVNLETLAQKASEMESLPSHDVKDLLGPWSPTAPAPGRGVGEPDGCSAKRGREESLVPLVIPVSVPVRRADPLSHDQEQGALSAGWPLRPTGPGDPGRPDHKPSVIVTRRRSLRNSLSESSGQNGGTDCDADGKTAKSKRRPRPEPLFIPPPKPGSFIAPAVYSSITPYQSHLRSPVRLAENPLTLPPYTPPPILSPVREGSGLYFSAILSAAAAAAAAGNQGLPPPATPKSATRSLLRSNSTEITPPVLSAMGEATPVSIEPRINIGQRYQAEVPELRERSEVLLDPQKAELVWAPLAELDAGAPQQQRVDDLMHLACSSALCGGGTNQELAMHCLYECKGDIMGALGLLLMKTPVFPKPHPLADYHYSGSDSWTPEERRIFNKGIGTYKKDFFMVQKMVSSKTVAQCVEFYYTYKKQVKMGRNGTLMYGEAEAPEPRPTDEEVDYKQSSQRFDLRKEEEDDRKWEGSGDRKRDSSPGRVTQSLQATESAGAVLVLRSQDDGRRDYPAYGMSHAPTAPPKPRPENAARKSGSGAKGPVAQEGEFPCKKCGRVFYKVKSRSAHMKSHAEQEKKAAAQRQREAEEQRAAAALMAAQQNGARGDQAPVRRASSEDSTDDEEDADDEDWH